MTHCSCQYVAPQLHSFTHSLQEIARLGGEASFLRRGEARLKSNLGFAEDRCSELQREVRILRQQVASFEASEHEAQVLDEVQRSVSEQSSYTGGIAAKLGGEPSSSLQIPRTNVCISSLASLC